MKKLMITMSAAAMFSLGANAADLLGAQDFESFTAGDPISVDAQEGAYNLQLWGGSSGESVVAGDEENKYLKVDTTDPLFRKTGTPAGETTQPAVGPVAIPEGGDITVSSKVQFTAADEAPTAADGDKLIVWMRAAAEAEGTEGDPGYKPAVSAAVMVTDKTGATAIKVIAADEVEEFTAAWHTLAIKAVAAGTEAQPSAAFTITLDGEAIDGTFKSLVTGGAAAQTIASIGFKGTGAVDDIAFASNEAEVVDTFKFGVTVTDTYDEEAGELPGFASASYSVDGAAAVEIPGTGLSNVAVPCTAKSVVVTVVAYADSKVTTTGAVKGDATTVEGDAAYFWTITKSVEGTTKDASVSISITIEKDGEPTPTDDPEIVVPEGKEIADVIAAATSETGIALANVTSEDQVVIDNAEHTIKVGKAEAVTIADFYTAALASDMKSITLTLNAKALDTAGDMVEVAVDQAFGLKVSASNAKLYYGLASSDTVTGEYAAPTTLMQGNGSALTLAAPKKEGAAGFYKLYVTDIAPVK